MIRIVAVVVLELALLGGWSRRAKARPAEAAAMPMFDFPAPPACSRSEVLVHIAPATGDGDLLVLEFPVAHGWDEQSILTTIAEIEAL